MSSKKLLILPDSHVHPQYSNDRFFWLGNLIAEERPDTILCLGDLADMPSLCLFEKGRASFEGRRYKDDLESAIEAQVLMFNPLHKLNKGKRGKAVYNPRRIFLAGNHEHRVYRTTEEKPELKDTLDHVKDLKLEEFWTEHHPYQNIVEVHGFACSHHMASGVAGRPISGINHAAQLLTKKMTSSIVGHSHLVDWSRRTDAHGRKMNAIVAGCYVADDYREAWCAGTRDMWDSGITLLDGVHDGDFEELRFISSKKMKEAYS